MNLLPYHTFEMRSPMKPAAAIEAIKAHVEPLKYIWWRWPDSKNDKRFTGDVTANSFELHRIMGYRNSFAPVALGEVTTEGAGSRIRVRMRLGSFALVFVLLICVIALGVVLIPAGEGVWLGLVFLPFVYGMTMIGFWVEATRQERTLREIFQGS